MGVEVNSRNTRKLLLCSASALAIGIAFAQSATAAPCGNGAGMTIAAACTGPFMWIGGDFELTNTGTISGSYQAANTPNGGTLGTFTNLGQLSATVTGFDNYAVIGAITNNGLIEAYGTPDAVGILNETASSIGVLTNTSTIKGHAVYAWGINNLGGSIGTLDNSGVIEAESSLVATGIDNGGRIDELKNSGAIRAVSTGSAVGVFGVGITNSGSIGTLTNSGSIEGVFAGLINNNTIDKIINSGSISSIYNNGGTISSTVGVAISNVSSSGTYGVIGTLTNSGLIKGTTGIVNAGTITVLTNTIGGLIDSASGMSGAGIQNSGSIGTLTNYGTIQGDASGIYNLGIVTSITNFGSIAGGGTGIFNGTLGSIGTIDNEHWLHGLQNLGTVDLLSNAEGATIAYQIFNAGTITELRNGGIIDLGSVVTAVRNDGQIGTLTNTGLISTPGLALFNDTSTITLVNSGTIKGDILNYGALTISGGSGGTVGTLTGYNESIGTFMGSALTFNTGSLLINDVVADGVTVVGTGGALSITGSIGGGSAGRGLVVSTGASLDRLANSGTISRSNTAVYAAGNIGTLTNTGRIETAGAGIATAAAVVISTITNQTGATINAQWALYNNGHVGTFTNAGTLTISRIGINNRSGGIIDVVENTGRINSSDRGIQNLTSIGSIFNSGTIIGGTGVVGTGIGINSPSGTIGTITNQGFISGIAPGLVGGQGSGILVGGTITEISNSGTIEGNRSGIAVANFATSTVTRLVNTGTIRSTGSQGGVLNEGTIGLLLNDGLITGPTYALFNTGSMNLTNAGTIAGNIDDTGTLTISGGSGGTVGTLTGYNGSIGIFSGTVLTFNTGALVLNDVIAGGVTVVGTGGSLTNTGTIGTVGGVSVGSLTALDSFTNSGEISAGTGAVLNYGLIGTVTNSGSLAGDAGIANAGTIAEIVNTGTGTILSTGGGAWAAGIINWGGSIGAIDNSGLISETGLGLGIVNQGTISLLTNGGKIENQGGGAAIGNVLGSIVSLNNSGEIIGGGTIAGTTYAAVENADVIGVLTNSGSITALGGGSAVYNTGSITLIANTDYGLITGPVAIQNEAGIGSISNGGAIAGALTGVVNTGTIGTLANSGTISGAVYAINSAGQITALENTGTIGGNIVTAGELNVTGGSGTVFGLLSGGTITGNIKLTGGNTRFADDVTGSLDIEGGIVEIASHVSITGSLTQGGGVLDLLSGGEFLVDGNAHLTSGLIVIEGLGGTGNYSAGDRITLITADDGSDYSSVQIQFGIPGISATTTVVNGDLLAVYTSEYIGGTLGNSTISGSIGGGDYGYFVGGTGSIGSLTNTGTLNGNAFAFFNGGTIGEFVNNGQIVDGTGFANAGLIGAMTNNGVISGGNGLVNAGIINTLTNAASGVISGTSLDGLQNFGLIGQLTNNGSISTAVRYAVYNSGTITGLTNAAGIIGGIVNDGGVIGTINNSALISSSAYAIDNAGSLGPISNSGTIEGNIRSTSPLAISGSTGSSYGLLSGGTITADVNFTSGNLRLSDAMVGQASNSGARLQLASTLTITGTYDQMAGTLELGPNLLTVSGKASITGGTVTAGLSSSANYLVGQSVTLIDAAAGSTYAGATVSLPTVTGLAATANTASTEDLAVTFGNDYIGASLASLTNTGTLSGAAYGVYVASSGTLTAIANSGTIRGTQYALYSAGSLGTVTNTGLISGNIRSAGVLVLAGSGGTLSGGTILAPGVSIAGSLQLADAINVGSGTVSAGTASVELASKITITGNYLQTGGVLISDITDATTYGALAVSGGATITNTTITLNGSNLRAGQTYTIVDASAASSYTGDTIRLSGTGHFRLKLQTTGDDLLALIRPMFGEIGAARGGPAAVVGGVLDRVADNNGLPTVVDKLSLLSDDDLGRALEQAAPAEVGGGAASLQRAGLIEDLIGGAVSSRSHANHIGWSIWQEALGGTARRDAVSGAAGYNITAAGLVLGADNRLSENLLIGAALSWSAGWNAGRGDVTSHANGVNGLALTGYAGWKGGALTVNGRLAIGLDRYNQHRDMTYLDDRAKASYSGRHYVIAADGGYDLDLAGNFTLTPQASLRWLRQARDGYTEFGAAGMVIGSATADQVQSGLGATLAWSVQTNLGLVVPELKVAWLHDFITEPAETNAVLGGISFTTTSARISANGIRIGTGLTFYQSDATSLRLEYDGEFRDDYAAHGGMLEFSLKL